MIIAFSLIIPLFLSSVKVLQSVDVPVLLLILFCFFNFCHTGIAYLNAFVQVVGSCNSGRNGFSGMLRDIWSAGSRVRHDTQRIKVNMPFKKENVYHCSLYLNRSVEDKPSQETENTQKIFQKEASFAGPSSGRALPPKKRKASSEELLVPVR